MVRLNKILRSSCVVLACFLGTTALADRTMIVFDASGSMWGQIDGVTKIEISRTAFASAETLWSESEAEIGLIAYGHRRKGDCSDIETLVPLGTNSSAGITDQVNALRPKGKTPLTDAIRLAATELRSSEEKATVVLFSDGIETCSADPCALAEDLERDGIDFTAHVIGFGLGSDTDRAQLQCIADNTGGQFIEAQNADGLAQALTAVAQTHVEIAPADVVQTDFIPIRITLTEAEGTSRPARVTIRATNVETGEKQALGTLAGASEVIEGLSAELPSGDWKLEAISEEGHGEITVSLTPDMQQIDIPFAAHDTEFVLIANGPYRLGIEHAFFLGVTDPLQANAEFTVALFPTGATDYNQRIDWETRFGSTDSVYTEHGFMAPETAGDYEIIVLKGYDLAEANARFPITFAEDAPIRWRGETRGEPGGSLPIEISGDTYRNNTLTLRDSSGNDITSQWLEAYRTDDAGLRLPLPDQSGVYELFYRATSEAEEISLGQITVGDVILEDDPDSVPPPDEEASADTVLLFKCEVEVCVYQSAVTGKIDLPLLQGFGVASERFDDEGRPSLDLVNTQSGDVILINPIHMVGTLECHLISENGRMEGMQNFTVCLPENSAGDTVYQFETLEAWAVTQIILSTEMHLPEDRAAHDATMGEDSIFTTSTLTGGWTLMEANTREIIGIIAFNPGGESTIPADLLLYASPANGLDGALQISAQITPMTDDKTALLGLTSMTESIAVQLSRAPDWDGVNNVFSGILTLLESGTSLRVEMF